MIHRAVGHRALVRWTLTLTRRHPSPSVGTEESWSRDCVRAVCRFANKLDAALSRRAQLMSCCGLVGSTPELLPVPFVAFRILAVGTHYQICFECVAASEIFYKYDAFQSVLLTSVQYSHRKTTQMHVMRLEDKTRRRQSTRIDNDRDTHSSTLVVVVVTTTETTVLNMTMDWLEDWKEGDREEEEERS